MKAKEGERLEGQREGIDGERRKEEKVKESPSGN